MGDLVEVMAQALMRVQRQNPLVVGYSINAELPQIQNAVYVSGPTVFETVAAVGTTSQEGSICNPRGGMATVMVDVNDTGTAAAITQTPNYRILLDVSWSGTNGLANMNATVDITRGTKFTISWARNITLRARLRGSQGGAKNKTISASVVWDTSGTACPAFCTLDPLTLQAGVASAAQTIPKFARSVMIQSDTPAGLANLQADFYTEQLSGTGALVCSTVNPFANSTVIAGGMDVMIVTQTGVAAVVSPVFELWL